MKQSNDDTTPGSSIKLPLDLVTSAATGKLLAGEDARSHFPYFRSLGVDSGGYLDSAATTQKPDEVIGSLTDVFVHHCANVRRGAYALSARATELYDGARSKIARFINAPSPNNIVFVRGATEGINLVAYGSEKLLKAGDTVLLTLLEHHSNIVPWQLLAERRGLKVLFADITDEGRLDMRDFEKKLKTYRPRLVSVTQLANSLGTITPIEEIVSLAQQNGARVLVDGSQGVSHLGVDVQSLGCDFYVFSGHKLYGPTGVGVLYGRSQALETLSPFLGGGDMISYVTTEGSGWAEIPQRFEAGTPSFPEAIALGAAIDFLGRIDRNQLIAHELELMREASEILSAIPKVKMYGPGVKSGEQTAVISFSLEGIHPHDIATVADEHGVQVRAGNHCAMPTLRRLGVQATARLSFGVYSTSRDLAHLAKALQRARQLFA
jgi:cysteine desulfurase/selenocysteine lyase